MGEKKVLYSNSINVNINPTEATLTFEVRDPRNQEIIDTVYIYTSPSFAKEIARLILRIIEENEKRLEYKVPELSELPGQRG
jgi:NADP-dependent 3-hydroxy acid dehydrogenase YdfG